MICIVSHDAGGAEILSSYVRQNKGAYSYSLDGPAVKIFSGKLGVVLSSPLEEAIEISEWVLCGTSWQSDIEWRAIGLARAKQKRSVAFIDHWVNYQERFVRNGIRNLPDEIWVGDIYAKALAMAEFPEITIRVVPNPHFEDIKIEVAELKQGLATKAKNRNAAVALFVCENISEHALLQYGDPHYWGYTEFDAIDYFFQNIAALGTPVSSVIIRPHPSDVPGKYDEIVRKHDGFARLNNGGTLLENIAQADIVAGCESMAMVIAVQCGRRVISSIPKKDVSLKLPFEEIEILSVLASR